MALPFMQGIRIVPYFCLFAVPSWDVSGPSYGAAA